ncbi:MAG: hypothetical protein J0I06_01070 [Planctomycetes bacterium]|nr:hypothetical protein [Planctomycetota bacterium]
MSRLSTLFVLGGAGLLFTPVAASAQFIRPFGLPGGAPLTVPIVRPVPLVPLVPIVRPVMPVAPVPLISPVIGWPQYQFSYGSRISFGGFTVSNQQFAYGPLAYAFRPGVPTYIWPTAAYNTYGVYGVYRPTSQSVTEYDVLAKAQREASAVAALSSGGSRNPAPALVVADTAAPVPADMARPALPPADGARIASGDALNDALKEIVRAEGKGAKGPSAYIPPLLMKDMRFAGSPAADLLNLSRQSGLDFPTAFDAPALVNRCGELADEFAGVAEAVRAGKAPDATRVTRLEVAFQRLEEASAPVIKDLPAQDATAAKQFLNRLSSAVKALKGGAAAGLIDPTWDTVGLTGADLVKHMTKHKLLFGPAPRGAEGSYDTMYGSLTTYLAVLLQPKK